MSKLNEFVKTVEENEPKFLKIEDFEQIPTDIEITEQEFTKQDGDTFKVFQTVIDEKTIRVPKSVLLQLKAQLEEKDFEFFKVKKSGSGMDTKYNVITL